MMKRRNRSQSIGIITKRHKPRKKTPTQAATLKIGEVSKKSGIPIVTLRFYENQGLIQSFVNAETKRSTHRRFSPVVLLQLDFVRVCRSAGFSIPEIKSLIQLYLGFKLPSKTGMSALKRSIDLIRAQKAQLNRIEKVLAYRLRHPEADLGDLFLKRPELF